MDVDADDARGLGRYMLESVAGRATGDGQRSGARLGKHFAKHFVEIAELLHRGAGHMPFIVRDGNGEPGVAVGPGHGVHAALR